MASIAMLAVVMGTMSAQAQTSEPVGTTSGILTATVTITAAGTSASTTAAALPVLTQGIAGLDFKLASGGTCAGSTAYTVGQTCTVDYTFTPSHPWSRYGGIEVVTDAGKVLGNSFVHGTGNGPQATFSLSTPTTPVTLGGGGFQGPTGIALDAAGNIFVADLNNNTVYEMLAAGGYTTIKTLGGGFNGPSTVAIDGSGNIYIANANGRTVSEMPPGCASAACVVTLGGGFTRAAGIAVDGEGNVYVADYNNQAVTEMPPNCFNTSCMTNLGGGFRNPRDVAVDGNGNVYVVDPVNVALTRMPAGCTQLSCVTTLGGGFNYPGSVAVDGAGNVYVGDLNNNMLKEIGPTCFDSSCVVTLGRGFSFPAGVALDGSGNIYVVNQFYDSVQRLDFQDAPSLSFAGTTAGDSSAPQVVTLSNSGNLPLTISGLSTTNASLTGDTTCDTNTAIAAGGGCSLSIEFSPDAQGTQNTGSVSITSNTLYANPNFIQAVQLSGLVLGSGSSAQTISFPAPASPVQNGVPPVSLGATASSGLPVSYAITGPATISASMLTINGLGMVTIVASQNGNDTYAAAAPVTRTILVSSGPILSVGTSSATLTATLSFNSTGTLSSTLSTAIQVVTKGATGLDFNYVSGGTCLPGMSFVPNQTCTVEYTFTPTRPWTRSGGARLLNSASSIVSSTYLSGVGSGAQTTFALSTPGVPILLGGSFADPQGVALDGYGNVYVADLGKHAVYEILAAGGYTTIKTLGGGFNSPAGIAVDGLGNVYVSDEALSVVTEMPPGCASSSCVTAIGGGFHQVLALAVDGLGNVYVGDIVATVARIPPGCFSASCVIPLGGGFVLPYGVAVDAGGNVYVADRQKNQVTVMSADCASVSCVVPLGGGFTSPDGIAVDETGNVYVAESGNVTEMPPGCYGATCVTTLGPNFVFPVGLAVDGSGNVFLSDAGHAKVYKIDLQDPPSLSFADTPFGTPSAPQLVTVGNNGNLPLTISTLTLADASLGTGTSCTTSAAVTSGATCALNIEFTPATLGSPLSGSVSINDNDLFNPNATQVIGLTGNGVQQTPTLTLASVPTVGQGRNSLLSVWLMWTGAGAAPTGAVTFRVDNGTALNAVCTGTASPILCSYSGSFAVGSHTLNASYAGDTNYTGAAATPGSFTISTATLTIKANDANRFYGSANPAFTGLVSGAQPGDSFVESFTTSAATLSPVATYAIVPSVTGADVSSYMETIVNGTLTVAPAPTSIALSASSPSLASGQSVTFTAQVSPFASGTPTEIVTILDNGSPLTTLTLNGGSATYVTTALSPGIAHALTAAYGGDGNFLGTKASGTPAGTVTVAVSGTDTALTPTSGTSFTVIPGGALSFDLLLTPQPGAYPGPVTFSISGLPPGATATFNPRSLSAVTSPTTVHVTIQTADSTAKLIRMHGDMGAIALGLLLIPIGCSRRTRKRLGNLSFFAILLGGVLSSMVITGCGSNNGFFRQAPKDYTLTITATSGSVQHVATITLNIQ
jgi:sugar lactone lactonase YvrE